MCERNLLFNETKLLYMGSKYPLLVYSITIVGLIVISGCVAQEQTENLHNGSDTPMDEASCVSTDGEWIRAGLAQQFRCVHEHSDGGKDCNSSDECEGLCIVKDSNSPAYCKHNDNPFGCYATVEDVETQGILCID